MKLRGVGSLVEIRTSDQSLVLREDGSRGVGSPVGAEPLSGVDVLMSERSSAEQWRCYYVLRIEDEVLVCVLSSSHPEPQEYMRSIDD